MTFGQPGKKLPKARKLELTEQPERINELLNREEPLALEVYKHPTLEELVK